MTIESDIQQLDVGVLVEMYEIDLEPIGVDEQYYLHNGVNELGNDVTWQSQVYTRFPIDADGFEKSGTGLQPTPTIRVANVTGLLSSLARENQDLVGVKVTRRRTFLKYMDAVNFTGGVNPTADPDVHFDDEIWFVDRKAVENRVYIEWELKAGSDLSGLTVPRRRCIQNVCTWQYRSTECSYSGGAVANALDEPVSDITLDVCGKRMSSCLLRFPAPLNLKFAGFPAVGLLR